MKKKKLILAAVLAAAVAAGGGYAVSCVVETTLKNQSLPDRANEIQAEEEEQGESPALPDKAGIGTKIWYPRLL